MENSGLQKYKNKLLDLFDAGIRSDLGLEFSSRYDLEHNWNAKWVWGLGDRTTLKLKSPLPFAHTQLFFRFLIPKAKTLVHILVDGKIAQSITSPVDGYEYASHLDLTARPSWTIEFSASSWNGKGGACFAPNDTRELSLCFSALKLSVERLQGDTKPFPGKICAYPFSRMEIGAEDFSPCCTWWLKEEIFFENENKRDWNGAAALKLRESILDGNFKYCDLGVCKPRLVSREELEKSASLDLPISVKNIAAIRAGQAALPEGPSAAVLISDPRCNLACPSCRGEHIHALSAEDEKRIRGTDAFLKANRSSIRILSIATDGEALFSPFLREKIREASRELYPSLDYVELISNGLLLTEKNFASLKPGIDLVKRIRVSVDAGDAATYSKVRGGSWDQLMNNLRWVSSLRKGGRLEFFGLNYVVRKENYRSLNSFLSLAQELGVDDVYISKLIHWHRMAANFESEAIAESFHPDYPEFSRLWEDVRCKNWNFPINSNF